MTVQKTTRNDAGSSALINEKIRFDRMQLIAADGQNEGVVSRDVALRMARESGLDLVIIADQGRDGVPVAKIMDHGKSLYAKKKQAADAKKKQHVIQIKELKVRPKISTHDLQTKMNQSIDFLNEGKRVKFTLVFRGREIAMKAERGGELFDKIHSQLESVFPGQSLIQEKDTKSDALWSRVYYLKSK